MTDEQEYYCTNCKTGISNPELKCDLGSFEEYYVCPICELPLEVNEQ